MKCWKSCNTEYVPKARDSSTDDADQYKVLHKVAFGGDHLTVERGISAAAAVGDSDTPFERLEGRTYLEVRRLSLRNECSPGGLHCNNLYKF